MKIPNLIIALMIIFSSALRSRALNDPQVKWSISVDVHLDASPLPYPVSHPDGVVVGTCGHVTRLDGSGNVIFDRSFGPQSLQGAYNYDISFADLNGDGQDEILSASQEGVIYALNANDGATRWQYDLGARLGMFRFLTPADIDGDGNLEILAASTSGWLVCLTADGKFRWRFKSEPYRISTPSVADINNDDNLEIVFGTCTHHVIALTADGQLLWDQLIGEMDFSRTKPIIADADKDGLLEIYTMSCRRSLGSGLVAINADDGSLRWQGAMTHKAYYALTVVDLDGDGKDEILAADKGTAVSAFSAGGELLWRTPVNGRGIWTAPAVADIDGDGQYEILTTVRDQSDDGNKFSWYVLSTKGKILAGYQLKGGAHGAPLVADIDQDGILEVVLASRNPGTITAFSFGGKVHPKAVLSSFQRQVDYPIAIAKKPFTPGQPETPTVKVVADFSAPKFGSNKIKVSLPQGYDRLGVELCTRFPNGGTQIQVFKSQESTQRLIIDWPAYQAGKYRLQLRLLDFAHSKNLGELEKYFQVKPFSNSVAPAVEKLLSKFKRQQIRIDEQNPAGAEFISQQVNGFDKKLENLSRTADTIKSESQTDCVQFERALTEFANNLERAGRYAQFLEGAVSNGKKPEFVMWQDGNPWDNQDMMSEMPLSIEPTEINTWAFGNEIESVCINLVSVSPQVGAVRIDPGIITKIGDSEFKIPTVGHVDWYKVVVVPNKEGEQVPDLLPKIGDDFTVTLVPGTIQKLWLNLKTTNLSSGEYTMQWRIRTMSPEPFATELKVNLKVSPVRLPDSSRYAANFWSQNRLGKVSTIADLNEHLQTVWYRVPLPPARANTSGEIVEEPDWSEHDAIITNTRQIVKILYNFPRTPSFPKGFKVTQGLRLLAQKNYAKKMMSHLRELGLDYDDFMFYPMDEPGLVGSIETYMRNARQIKAIDPQFLVYANPTGGITLDQIREMATVADVWQPEMNTIVILGKAYLDAMRKGGKPIWTYTAQDNIRALKSLGFYRAQAWFGFYWGLQGGGYWVYHSDDLWATRPEDEPSYGSVAFDGRTVVSSRRWEATRDGIEDYNMLCLMQDAFHHHPDETAQALLSEAVSYVAQKNIVTVPREAADYEIDFERLQQYRAQIRDFLEAEL